MNSKIKDNYKSNDIPRTERTIEETDFPKREAKVGNHKEGKENSEKEDRAKRKIYSSKGTSESKGD